MDQQARYPAGFETILDKLPNDSFGLISWLKGFPAEAGSFRVDLRFAAIRAK